MRTVRQLATVQRALDSARIGLRKGHWGTDAPDGKGHVPRFYILDLKGLLLAAGVLRYQLHKSAIILLYRGQVQDWEPVPKLYRGSCRADRPMRGAWLDKCLTAMAEKFDPTGKVEEREALAQHYGLPTRWLDAVDNIQTAAWFAGHRVTPATADSSRDASVGYIQVFACSDGPGGFARARDLRLKPSTWMRPHIQQAWAIQSPRPTSNCGSLASAIVCTFIVPRPLLHLWSGYNVMTAETMFPNKSEDRGLEYFCQAEEHLRRLALLPCPWDCGGYGA